MTDITITLTKSERRLAEFAAWMFAREARARMDAAAQDKAGRYFKIGDVAKFHRDASEADSLVGKLRNGRAQPTVIVQFDLSTASIEGAIRDKLIAMGWTPPGQAVDSAAWRKVAAEAYREWDGDNDVRVGKLLKAMAEPSFARNYRADIAALHNDSPATGAAPDG